MDTVNVNRNISDVFYHYKMRRLVTEVESQGNSTKTILVNIAEVAKALRRPPIYLTKYFGCELDVQTQFDFKNERYIVVGSHEAVKLQGLLDGFIRRFVLCPECENPETNLLVSAKQDIVSQDCKACGYHGQLESNHKLITYILKNPPNFNSALRGYLLIRHKRNNTNATGKHKEANVEVGTGSEPVVKIATIEDRSEDKGCAQSTVDESDETVCETSTMILEKPESVELTNTCWAHPKCMT